jgi:predicted metal-binding membrane protein
VLRDFDDAPLSARDHDRLVSSDVVQRRDVPIVVPVAISVAWIAAAATYAAGYAIDLRHDKLFHGGPPAPVAIGAFVAAWVVSVVAVLVPPVLPEVRQCGRATAEWAPTRGPLAFLGGYLAVWVVFGLALLVLDHGVHTVVDAAPWLGARPWLVSAATLAMAGAYEWTSAKARWLARSRGRVIRLRPTEQSLVVVFDLGRSVGAAGLVAFWALVVVMFAEGVGDVGVMAALAVAIGYEQRGRYGAVAARVVGVVLVVLAVVTVVRH